jgi:hypothetical protein
MEKPFRKPALVLNLLAALWLLLLLPSCTKPEPPRMPYSFFIAGHSYGSPDAPDSAFGLYPPFVNEFGTLAQWPGMKMGFLTGDIVHNPTAKKYAEVQSQLERLPFRVQAVPGNHDILTLEGKKEFEKLFGSSNDWIMAEGDLFIRLDVNASGWKVTAEQLSMIDFAFKRPVPWKNAFIFVHQVIWWENESGHAAHRKEIYPNSEEGREGPLNFWSEMMPVLKKIKKPVYVFAGDVGARCTGNDVSQHREDNVRLIASGMGCAKASNYLIAEVDSLAEVHFVLRSLQGSPDYMGNLSDYSW